ncbi:MAG: hypothetical protein LLF98_02030 [Clostridium sp.]|uniref:distal tail protein Dit n=1 Tax=Clostridium sp. TaxID=1506 RepID=UPI0025C15894|nr:distal tail protein Dit [Clostridium sp.]MCE5220060.1 hypothetical protein [Clostridium sp.]
MIKDSLYFIYDGIKSEDQGLWNVNIDSGMLEETFIANRSIEKIKSYNNKFYFKKINYEPIIILVSFAFKEEFTNSSLDEVKDWLCQSYYKPLQFSENLDRIYYAMITESSDIVHNGLNQGYLKLTFETNAYHGFSPVYQSPLYNLDNNTADGTIIELINKGSKDLLLYPEISLVKTIEDGDVSIINLTNGGLEFKFTGLKTNEDLYINNEEEIIITNLPNTYRYNDFNKNYLSCVKGINRLKILGKCQIQLKYQYKLF